MSAPHPIPAAATVEEWRALWEAERARGDAATERARLAEERAERAEAACAALRLEVEELRRQLQELKARLGSDSSNSSRPPSADPPQAQTRRRKIESAFRKRGKRKPGGQKGHPGVTRSAVDPASVKEVVDHYPTECGACDATLDPGQARGRPVLRYELEMPPPELDVIEHRYHSCLCRCGARTRAEVPVGSRVFLGTRLTAFVAVLVGEYHLSRRLVASLLESLFGERFSIGTIQACCLRVGRALHRPVEDLFQALPGAAALHLDETGWRVRGIRSWLWCAVTSTFACFAIHRRRGREQLDRWFPAGLDAIVHSDRWSAYRWIDPARRQLCWAHLLRDLLAVVDARFAGAPGAKVVIEEAHEMFHHWHAYKAGELAWEDLRHLTQPFRDHFRRFCEAGAVQADDRRWRALSGQLIKLWPAVFNFLDLPGLEPTNNHAERALRAAVLWRRITQGTRSDEGSMFVAHMLTVSATCRLQRRSLLDFVAEALRAAAAGTKAPGLLAA